MEDNQNGRRLKLKTTKMEENPNLRIFQNLKTKNCVILKNLNDGRCKPN